MTRNFLGALLFCSVALNAYSQTEAKKYDDDAIFGLDCTIRGGNENEADSHYFYGETKVTFLKNQGDVQVSEKEIFDISYANEEFDGKLIKPLVFKVTANLTTKTILLSYKDENNSEIVIPAGHFTFPTSIGPRSFSCGFFEGFYFGFNPGSPY